ncbi:MAG: class I SAM-dependent methyltransferase [Deltaproteobacteria bacterium]|nr:class I SAM-dependent methyltransferase [Deltaproteobacteria bacterium]
MTKISETAFLVNYLRSKNKELSGDIYSDLWIEETTSELAEEFQREINPLESYQLSLRHRFFLEWVKKAIAQGVERVINVGAGFSTYTHLVEPPIPTCDVDYQHIVAYKAQKLKEFETKKLIPHREIVFLPTDLNNSKSLDKMKEQLKKWVITEKSLAILEGITYYLNKQQLDRVFNVLSKIQSKGSLIAVLYWKPDAIDNSVFKKWIPFAKKNYSYDPTGYTYLTKGYFEELDGYHIVDFATYFDLEKRFAKNNRIRKNNDNVFPEDFVVLEKVR